MTDDEFIEFVEKTALPALERHVLFRTRYRTSREDIEDIVQETLIRFLNVKDSPPEAPMAWLKQVANNILIDRWRTTSKKHFVPLDDSQPDITKPDEVLAKDAFRDAVLKLKAEEREVLDQLFMGKTHAEIAQSLDMPTTTVAHYIREAKAKLRRDPKLSAIYRKGE